MTLTSLYLAGDERKPRHSSPRSLPRNPPPTRAGPSPASCLFNYEYILEPPPTSLLMAQYASIRHRLKNAKNPGWCHSTPAVGAAAFIPEALAHELQGLLFQSARAGGERRCIPTMGGYNK